MRSRLRLVLAQVLLSALAMVLVAGQILAQAPARDPAEPAKAALDQIETALERRLTGDELTDLKRKLDPVRDALVVALAEVEPRLTEARDRLTQLGPKPADNAPPEAPEARQMRDTQTKAVADIDARVRNIKVLQVRADQLADRIVEKRRQLFTAELFERSNSVVDPRFWSDLSGALPWMWRSAGFLIGDWWQHLTDVVGTGRLAVAAAVGLMAAGALFSIYRTLRRRGLYRRPDDKPASQLAKVLADLRVAAERSLVLPILVGIAVAIVENFGLVLPRAEPLVPQALIAAVLVISFTRGVMQGVFAPGAPAYRLVPVPDEQGDAIFDAMRVAAWVVASGVFFLAIARVLIAPVAITALITSLTALAIVGVIVVYLRRTMEREPDEAETPEAETPPAGEVAEAAVKEPPIWGWTRPALWLIVAVVVVGLIAGYSALAAFVATRLVAAVVIAAATILILNLLDAVIAEWCGASTHRGRVLAASIGIKPERLQLVGTLLAGVLRVVILVMSAFTVFGPWGFGGAAATLDDAFFGLRFHELRTLALTVAGGVLVLLIGFFMLRGVQRWVRDKVLPLSGMDAGLQNSVSTIFGYAGFALVLGITLRQLGLDLSNLAIVAGALSVGIGFGLQSITSNFVSGLILLAERPIRVGDSIVVKGEEGYVRKISVRSTEIETFERATVIVPNAEMITGVVKNWTHSNTLSRIAVPVRVAYESDPEVVRDELIAVACENRFIMQQPPPRVFLMRFADSGLDFELRCVVSNVEYSLTVRSDLQLAILSRFRERGIMIAPPPPAAIARL
ncbi:DUF3772 domain-containing protein [Phreatobacter stygius]|uniref:Mechanosensitive ion channel family protein n=2 Tax=Pseudomonadota TaxID=1224 RepID=A0A4D7AUA7_9HYPH|nr:DUF3772 domain-containing protein [Phreatobacter stygius]QCI64459.1 mechanosensitive ion channel family protein [Phreatobacter stygius]